MTLKVVEIATDEELLKALREQPAHKQTPDEAREQRVSFVYGALKSDSNITKEQVRRVLAGHAE